MTPWFTVYDDGEERGSVQWTNESQARNDANIKNDGDRYDEADYVQSDERPDPAEVLG